VSLTLYGYWRSSASWRLRWAFEHKKISYTYVPVDLLKGEHKSAEHLARNPAGLVPSLVLGDGKTSLNQSMAILQYLEEIHPEHALLPSKPQEKAQVLSLCEIINSDTAPLQTPRVQKRHSADAAEQLLWAQDWIRAGLKTFEKAAASHKGIYAFGDTLSAADLFLVPQLYNARRYKIDLSVDFPALEEIYATCFKLESCQKSSPENQPDATL
jgi:maleylpyruvate isomerase